MELFYLISGAKNLNVNRSLKEGILWCSCVDWLLTQSFYEKESKKFFWIEITPSCVGE